MTFNDSKVKNRIAEILATSIQLFSTYTLNNVVRDSSSYNNNNNHLSPIIVIANKMVKNDRLTVSKVKITDFRLHREIASTIKTLDECDVQDMSCWNKLWHECILPHKMVISKMKDSDERNIVHLVLLTYRHPNADHTYLEKVIEEFLGLVVMKDIHGEYPLHIALRTAKPLVPKLVDMFPEAVEQPNRYGAYPLHDAMKNHTSEETIMKMIELFPRPVTIPDKYGYYPLHMAFRYYYSDIVVVKIIDVFPQAVEMTDTANNYALTAALYFVYDYSSPVFLKLIEYCPKAVDIMGLQQRKYHWYKCKSDEQLYPLQVVLRKNEEKDNQFKSVVLKMMELCPEVCTKISFDEVSDVDNDIQNAFYHYVQIYQQQQQQIVGSAAEGGFL